MNRTTYSRFKRMKAKEIDAMIDEKNRKYARPEDAFSTFRKGERHGVVPLVNLWCRMLEKVERIDNMLVEGDDLVGEGIYDGFADLIGYSYLAMAMLEDSVDVLEDDGTFLDELGTSSVD